MPMNGVVTLNTMKTKDAAMLLDVSQTTVKRWASQYPASFHKDQLGHYVFSGHQINMLLYIKEQIEEGRTLDQIALPVSPPLASSEKLETAPMPKDNTELLARIREIERSVGQKADEVVSAQVLQHRAELDELRQMVSQLAATIETLHARGTQPPVQRDEFRLSMTKEEAPIPAKKRRFFQSFF